MNTSKQRTISFRVNEQTFNNIKLFSLRYGFNQSKLLNKLTTMYFGNDKPEKQLLGVLLREKEQEINKLKENGYEQTTDNKLKEFDI